MVMVWCFLVLRVQSIQQMALNERRGEIGIIEEPITYFQPPMLMSEAIL